MGSNDFYSEERPVHKAAVDGLWIDEHLVTNAQFERFVSETGYITVAERAPNPADYPGVDADLLVPGSLVFRRPPHRVSLKNFLQWWSYEPGASWKNPEGAGSHLAGRETHPVVHVAYEDAEAFAAWGARVCQPKRSGSLPRAVDWKARSLFGATSLLRKAE